MFGCLPPLEIEIPALKCSTFDHSSVKSQPGNSLVAIRLLMVAPKRQHITLVITWNANPKARRVIFFGSRTKDVWNHPAERALNGKALTWFPRFHQTALRIRYETRKSVRRVRFNGLKIHLSARAPNQRVMGSNPILWQPLIWTYSFSFLQLAPSNWLQIWRPNEVHYVQLSKLWMICKFLTNCFPDEFFIS